MRCQKCDSNINNGEIVCNVCGTLNTNTDNISTKIAWENSEDRGIIASFFKTVYTVFVKPSDIFSNITDNSSLFKALLFAIIAGSIGGLGEIIWQTLFINFPALIPERIIPTTIVDSGKIITYAPMITVGRVAILSIYVHLMLIITGAKKRNIVATAVAVCYIQAVSLLALLSPVGNFSGLWGFFLIVFMASRLHKISGLRAFITVVLPFFVFIGLIAALMVLFVGSAMLAFTPMLKYLIQ